MPLQFKAVIFDLDGVLCSTDEYHYLAWKSLADRLNIFFDRDINQQLRGVSRMQSLDIVLQKSKVLYSDEDKQKFADLKNQLYVESLQKLTPDDLLPTVLSTLRRLRRMGLKLAVGSSSRNAPFILRQLGLDTFFDAVADGNQIAHSKPDPEVFQLAAHLINIPPENCLVVEDAAAGIEAAKAGGMAAAGIGNASGSPLADYRLGTIADLLDILSSPISRP